MIPVKDRLFVSVQPVPLMADSEGLLRTFARVLPFLLPYVILLSVVICYEYGGLWAFAIVHVVYLASPLFDLLLGRDKSALAPSQGRNWSGSRLCRLGLWLWAPTQAAFIAWALAVVSRENLGALECWALACSLGLTGGIVGFTVAHELAHGPGWWDRLLADLLATLSSYPHFASEHMGGHHREVGTAADTATARPGENLYAFLCRRIPGGLACALRLEARRLGRPFRGMRNRFWRYGLQLLIVYLAVGFFFGTRGVLVFAAQSLVAVFLLETINYVQHYGLKRREVSPGRFEPVRPWHSWDSSHRFSNALSFNLGRHSDHHCRTERPYQDLRPCPEAPQLPSGYAAMAILAYFPPLWHLMIDRRLRAWREKHGDDPELVNGCNTVLHQARPERSGR
jgi:alkane 1-monooxygenase